MKKNELFEKCASNVNPETRAEVERNITLLEEFEENFGLVETSLLDAILWGMRKQKQIDFGKIDDDCEGCDLCKKVYQEKLIEKAKQAFTKVCGWLEILPSYNEMLNEFVQELEKTKQL